MGFAGLSFLGGAAKRGSELLQEERDNIEKVTDASLKFWTETGIGKYNERKNKRKDLSSKFTTLTNDHKFSADQIDVIARQGKVDDVISYLATQRERGLTVEPSDVVRFSGDYKETGRTVDQILDGVMGKVNSGMSVSDAIQDTTGKTTGFLGQDLGKIAQKRAEAFSGAFGMPIEQLRALATDDITMTDSPVSGQLFMKDEVAEAQARAAIQGKGLTAGQESYMGTVAADAYGVDAKMDQYGNFTGFAGENPAAIKAASRARLEAANYYDTLMRDGVQNEKGETVKLTSNEARLMTHDFIQKKGDAFRDLPPDERGKIDSGTGEKTSSGSLPSYSGIGMSELPSSIAQELQGVTDPATRQALVRQAEKVLQDALIKEEGLNPPAARAKAQEELQRIINSLK
tara:strand:- start:940 stop:2145 length:1206 start_codon:yes stop_codon:yes gene_type:complete